MTNQPKPAPTAEEREENECVRCYATMGIPYGLEPTEVCNLCAQEERLALKDQLAEKDAKIAELERQAGPERLRSRLLGVVDGFRAAQPDASYEELRTRADSAEASLRAVSEALEEKLEMYAAYVVNNDGEPGECLESYRTESVEALFARIRSILDSK